MKQRYKAKNRGVLIFPKICYPKTYNKNQIQGFRGWGDMFNRRKTKRLEIAVPLNIALLGTAKYAPYIKAFTKNISPVGLSTDLQVTLRDGVFVIEAEKERVFMIPYLVLEKKEVALEITIPPHDKKIKATGRVIWYDLSARETSYCFRVGIHLEEMENDDRTKWARFVRDTARKTGKIWQYMQIVSACTFIAGIVIYIAGLGTTLAATAKIGIFFSVVGLLGFVIGWWQYRSFMLLKKFKLF